MIDIVHNRIKIILISDDMVVIIPLPKAKSARNPKKVVCVGFKATDYLWDRVSFVFPCQRDHHVDVIRHNTVGIDANPGVQNRNLLHRTINDHSSIGQSCVRNNTGIINYITEQMIAISRTNCDEIGTGQTIIVSR